MARQGTAGLPARSPADTKRIRYLLDLCSQAERECIEAEYFKDDAAFQAMLTAEDDLIDAYARGELTSEERRKFETQFLTSGRTRDRVQFARALSGVVSSTSLVETGPRATWLNIFESLRGWPLRIATVAGVIVLVVAISWIFVVRKRMSNEDAKVSKQAASSPRSATPEEVRHDRTTLQPERFSGNSDKSKPRKSSRHTQLARQLAIETVDSRRKVEIPVLGVAGRILGDEHLVHEFLLFSVRPTEALIDATLGNKFELRQITQLPLDARNVAGLLSLKPADDQGTSLSFSLEPRTTKNTGRTTITVTSSIKLITLQLILDVAKSQRDYRAVIETADGRQVTTLSWQTDSNSNVVNTPWISTVDLPSGSYMLFLAGKTSIGSFVRVGEFSFRVVRS